MYKGLLIVCLLTLLCASIVYAATTLVIDSGAGTPVTLTVPAGLQTALTRMLTRENAMRAARTPPGTALTIEEFIQQILVATFQGYKSQDDGLTRQDACARFKALTPAQQATVIARAEWGGASPCPQ